MAARRPPKARSEKAQPSLMEVALTKLDHRDRTKQQLKQLLARKAAERAASSTDPDAGASLPPRESSEQVEEVLARLEASGLVNDHRYAEHYARGARARGASQAKVQQMLRGRGVDRSEVEQALSAVAAEGLDELAAARSYVKRRRLAERHDLSDPKQRQKALASLARQGFSSNTALQALGPRAAGDAGSDDESGSSDADPDDV